MYKKNEYKAQLDELILSNYSNINNIENYVSRNAQNNYRNLEWNILSINSYYEFVISKGEPDLFYPKKGGRAIWLKIDSSVSDGIYDSIEIRDDLYVDGSSGTPDYIFVTIEMRLKFEKLTELMKMDSAISYYKKGQLLTISSDSFLKAISKIALIKEYNFSLLEKCEYFNKLKVYMSIVDTDTLLEIFESYIFNRSHFKNADSEGKEDFDPIDFTTVEEQSYLSPRRQVDFTRGEPTYDLTSPIREIEVREIPVDVTRGEPTYDLTSPVKEIPIREISSPIRSQVRRRPIRRQVKMQAVDVTRGDPTYDLTSPIRTQRSIISTSTPMRRIGARSPIYKVDEDLTANVEDITDIGEIIEEETRPSLQYVPKTSDRSRTSNTSNLSSNLSDTSYQSSNISGNSSRGLKFVPVKRITK